MLLVLVVETIVELQKVINVVTEVTHDVFLGKLTVCVRMGPWMHTAQVPRKAH